MDANLTRTKRLEDRARVRPLRTNGPTSATMGPSPQYKPSPLPSIRSAGNLIKSVETNLQQSTSSSSNRSIASPAKVDFDDLINDLISLSYSVNYTPSVSTDTLDSSHKATTTDTRRHQSNFNALRNIRPYESLARPSTAHLSHSSHRVYAPNRQTSLHSIGLPGTQSMGHVNYDKSYESCPPFQTSRASLNSSINNKRDVAVNTDLFMDDIITRNELNQYMRKQTLIGQSQEATISCSRLQARPANRQYKRLSLYDNNNENDITQTSNQIMIRRPTMSSSSATTTTNTSLPGTNATTKNNNSDTGYDTYEPMKCDNNSWNGILNELSQAEQTNQSLPVDFKLPGQHVTTIIINQTTSSPVVDDTKCDILSKSSNDMQSATGDKQTTRDIVKIRVELGSSQATSSQNEDTSVSISISPESTNNPQSQPSSGQLFGELTTTDEESESFSLSEDDSEPHDTSSSSDETSLSDQEGEVSSLGSYQDPSDFEEYRSFAGTPERNQQHQQHPQHNFTASNAGIGTSRRPSRELEVALEFLAGQLKLNDSISRIEEISSCLEMIRKEWFQVATRKDSCFLIAKAYLESFESYSKQLLNTVVNLTDNGGNSVIHYAASHFNFKLLDVLLDTKVCDLNRRNKAGYTPIMLLALADIEEDAQEIVARRIFQLGNVNVKAEPNGQTALMLAASRGRITTCKILLESGADPSLQDADGSTALMCASEMGHIDIVKTLLAHRLTDPNTTDNDGLDALAIAMEKGHRDLGLVLYAAKNMLRTRSTGSSGVGASLRRSSGKSSSQCFRRAGSLISPKKQYRPKP